jgi:hypothetical protein
MSGGKNNTQRIETLESHAARLSSRLDVHETLINGLDELLKKCSDASDGHGSKITVIEQHLLFVDLKSTVATLALIKENLIAINKDIEILQSWKAEQKREKEEVTRRWWAFGPNITAAIIGGFITIIGVIFNVGLTYFLNKSR